MVSFACLRGVGAGLLLVFRYIDRRRDLAALNGELERVSRPDSLTGVHDARDVDDSAGAADVAHARP